jgi:hypothetical protein
LGGREKYLEDCLASSLTDSIGIKLEHHLIMQGCKCPDLAIDYLKFSVSYRNYEIHIHEWPENIGIGAGLNKIIPECRGSLIFKMDDDCEIISKNTFAKAFAIHQKFPDLTFSPYPVGLINNPGGPRGNGHFVWADSKADNFYTFRRVSHVGGFARFTPASLMKSFKFKDDLIPGISGDEDGQYSNYLNSIGKPMCYLENGLVVEHNESTLGQIARFPQYFTSRTNESKMNIEVVR